MADIIKVNTEELNHWATDIASVADTINRARGVLASIDTSEEWWTDVHIEGTLRMKDMNGAVSAGDARQVLAGMTQMLNRYEDHIRKLSGRIRESGELFDEAEFEVAAVIAAIGGAEGNDAGGSDNQLPYNSALITALNYPSRMEDWTMEMRRKYAEYINKAVIYECENGNQVFSSNDLTLMIGPGGALIQKLKTDSSFSEFSKKTQNYNGRDGLFYSEKESKIGIEGFDYKKSVPRDYMKDKDGKELRKKYSNKKDGATTKRDFTIAQFGAEWARKDSILHKEGHYGDDNTYIQGNVDVGFCESHASITGGLYRTTVSKDGKETRHLEPGIAAEIGVSFGLLDVSGSARIGNEYVGATAEVGTRVGVVDVSGDLELGIVDGKLSAHAGGGVEVIAAEVSGSMGVDVLGVEGKVTGKLSTGLGIKGEIGYHDGKIVMEGGVVVGVGGSVRVEIDAGEAIDNIVEHAQDMVESAQGACEAIGDFIKDFNWFK